MDFITEEVKTKLNLTDEAIAELTPLYENKVADLKKEFGETANTNAEKIIEGAVKSTEEATGVKREVGEKNADYLKRVGSVYLATLKTEVEQLKTEYQTKLKEFKGDEATSKELQEVKEALDLAKQTLADYDSVKEKASKYDETAEQLSGLKLQVSFQSVKPSFPDTVNEYEAKAKWDIFVNGVREKYNIELVEGEAIAIDKENEHKRTKLKDLVDKDEELIKLLQGRNQQGMGANQKDLKKVEGVPFDVPKDATSEERSKLIKDYLISQNVPVTSQEYSTKFAELNTKIKNAK